MIFETGGRMFYMGDDYFAPTWWDNWVKGNLKNYKALSWRIERPKK